MRLASQLRVRHETARFHQCTWRCGDCVHARPAPSRSCASTIFEQARSEAAVVAASDLGGARSIVIVPMLKEDQLIGMISIYRQEVRPFGADEFATYGI